MANNHKGFPTGHVIGFIVSLALTFAAVGIVFQTDLSKQVIMWIIGTLAVLQALLQLIAFMHLGEGEDGKAKYVNMAYAFFMAAVIVVGSIWVLSMDNFM